MASDRLVRSDVDSFALIVKVRTFVYVLEVRLGKRNCLPRPFVIYFSVVVHFAYGDVAAGAALLDGCAREEIALDNLPPIVIKSRGRPRVCR